MLYGRDAERAEIDTLLAAARQSRGGALVVRGEAGLGKTSLLADVRERAAEMHLLTAQGIESESELPFAGLHQLIRPALTFIESLPPTQAEALRGALGLSRGTGDDRFRISAACLTLLADLAEGKPVLCLVDDVQWLDKPSADALLFVARRIAAEAIAIVFATREDDGGHFDARGLASLHLRGLDEPAATALIERSAAGGIAPRVRDLLIQQAGGNALALVELPAALSAGQLSGAEPMPDSLPLTPDVERLFLDRIRLLPVGTQQLLLLVAADDTGRLAPVMRAAQELAIGDDALETAERSGFVSVRGMQLEARHPLIRSAVYQDATSGERRTTHLALAAAFGEADEADQRAWHLAAAAVGPDVEVADELERTAQRAQLRSGHAAAVTALERAADLSTDSTTRGRRLVAATTSAWRAGQPARATTLIERATPLVTDPALRAELDHVSGDIQQRCGSLPEGAKILLAGARSAARADPRRALEMLFDAASCGMQSGDYAVVVEAGAVAGALPPSEHREELFLANLLAGVGSLWLGATTREVPLMIAVLEHAEEFDKPRLLAGAAMGAGTLGDEAKEAALLGRAVTLARASGAADALTLALLSVAVAGVLAGRFAVAPEATEGLQLAQEAGLTGVASLHLAILAWLAGAKGADDECRAAVTEVSGSAANGNALAHSITQWGLALLELGRGEHGQAITRIRAFASAPAGVGHPLVALSAAPDLVEACVRAGRTAEARSAFEGLDAFAAHGGPPWALALAARCRALLDENGAAQACFEEALALHAQSNRPFDRARTELLFGEHLRRARQRVDSRAQLRAALATFESLGAAPWADRARAELRASGESARKRDPSTVSQLTPQELQVARFVADGLSNKEVAAQLFLSPRTIDAHLRSVFSKVGVTSRTQLARLPLGANGPRPELGAPTPA